MSIKELIEYVVLHREDLLVAAITIVAGYLRSGEPRPSPFGSFLGWSRSVRGAIMWAGGNDVVNAIGSRLPEADQEAATQRRVLRMLLAAGGTFGITAQRLVHAATPPNEDASVVSVLDEIARSRRGGFSAQDVTRALTAIRDRPRLVDGKVLRLTTAGNDAAGWPLWLVSEVGAQAPPASPVRE
jgi:hypothetical protein